MGLERDWRIGLLCPSELAGITGRIVADTTRSFPVDRYADKVRTGVVRHEGGVEPGGASRPEPSLDYPANGETWMKGKS